MGKQENVSDFYQFEKDLAKAEKELKIENWVLKDAVLFDKPVLNVKGKLSFWDFNMEETK